MGVITYSPPIPRNQPDINVGPDGRQYPFGWLGEEHRIGRFIIVESRRDQDEPEPESYAMYVIGRETGEIRRSTMSWRTLSEAVLATVMIEEGMNDNAISHVLPFVLGAIQSRSDD